jgi:hypothetical protein
MPVIGHQPKSKFVDLPMRDCNLPPTLRRMEILVSACERLFCSVVPLHGLLSSNSRSSFDRSDAMPKAGREACVFEEERAGAFKLEGPLPSFAKAQLAIQFRKDYHVRRYQQNWRIHDEKAESSHKVKRKQKLNENRGKPGPNTKFYRCKAATAPSTNFHRLNGSPGGNLGPTTLSGRT